MSIYARRRLGALLLLAAVAAGVFGVLTGWSWTLPVVGTLGIFGLLALFDAEVEASRGSWCVSAQQPRRRSSMGEQLDAIEWEPYSCAEPGGPIWGPEYSPGALDHTSIERDGPVRTSCGMSWRDPRNG